MFEQLLQNIDVNDHQSLTASPELAISVQTLLTQNKDLSALTKEDWIVLANLVAKALDTNYKNYSYTETNNNLLDVDFLKNQLNQAPSELRFIILKVLVNIFGKQQKDFLNHHRYVIEFINDFIVNTNMLLDPTSNREIFLQLVSLYKAEEICKTLLNIKNFSEIIIDYMYNNQEDIDSYTNFRIIDTLIKYKKNIPIKYREKIVETIFKTKETVSDRDYNGFILDAIEYPDFSTELIETLFLEHDLFKAINYRPRPTDLFYVFTRHQFSFSFKKIFMKEHPTAIYELMQNQKFTDEEFQELMVDNPKYAYYIASNKCLSPKLAEKICNENIQDISLLDALFTYNNDKISTKTLINIVKQNISNTELKNPINYLSIWLADRTDIAPKIVQEIYLIFKNNRLDNAIACLLVNKNIPEQQQLKIIKDTPSILNNDYLINGLIYANPEKIYNRWDKKEITIYALKEERIQLFSDNVLNKMFPLLNIKIQKALLDKYPEKLTMPTLLEVSNSKSQIIRKFVQDIIEERPEYKGYITSIAFSSLNQRQNDFIGQKAYTHFIKKFRKTEIGLT